MKISIAFGVDQIDVFDQMLIKAKNSEDPRKICEFFDYVISHYPSRTKQEKHTKLNHIVKKHRSQTVELMIVRLENVTGQNLGADPQDWVKFYVK